MRSVLPINLLCESRQLLFVASLSDKCSDDPLENLGVLFKRVRIDLLPPVVEADDVSLVLKLRGADVSFGKSRIGEYNL